MLIPGGGATADVIRAWDQWHALGDEKAHWLALRALTLNAYFLAELVPGSRVVQRLDECRPFAESLTILDRFAFARWDEEAHPEGYLPHCWEATSDSLAARVAVVAEASRLCLLKSTGPPTDIDWLEPKYHFVDPLFREVLGRSAHRCHLQAVNLRDWQG